MPPRVRARGPRRAVVGLLTGCAQSVFFRHVSAATARVLALEGCEVVVPRGQGCCGALSLHAGRAKEAKRLARRLVATFTRASVDVLITDVAGCGSAMKGYARLLADDPRWARAAAELADKVRDVTEFLAEIGPVAPRHPVPITLAYHDACHLANGQGITRQPRSLLDGIPELRVVELSDGGRCCGSAGTYNLTQPATADRTGCPQSDRDHRDGRDGRGRRQSGLPAADGELTPGGRIGHNRPAHDRGLGRLVASRPPLSLLAHAEASPAADPRPRLALLSGGRLGSPSTPPALLTPTHAPTLRGG